VADVIPPELQRVVEFLNQRMDPAEVEPRQYVGDSNANSRTEGDRPAGPTAEPRREAAVG